MLFCGSKMFSVKFIFGASALSFGVLANGQNHTAVDLGQDQGAATQLLGASRIPAVIPLMSKRKKYRVWYKELCYSSWEAINAPNADGSEFKPDAIITSLQQTFALDLAEKLRIPMFLYNVFPVVPTDHFRAAFSLFMEGKSEGFSFVNRSSYYLFDKGLEIGVRTVARDFRKHLDLPRLRAGNRTMTTGRLARMHVPSFCIWSPNLLDAPEDYHENAVVVGSVDRTGGLGVLPDYLMDYILYFEKGDRVEIDNSGVFGTVTHTNEIESDERRYFVELDPTNDPSHLQLYVSYSGQPLKRSQLSHENGPKEPPLVSHGGLLGLHVRCRCFHKFKRSHDILRSSSDSSSISFYPL